MSIDEAIDEFDFFNEGDYITRRIATAKDIVLKKLHETESDLYEANNCISDLLDVAKQKDKEIEHWKEQAEGYSGLAKQIKEDFENRDRWE